MTTEMILHVVILVMVIAILIKVMMPEQKHTKKHTRPTNKTCPISGEAIDHPGSEPTKVELPNGNELMVCSKNCKNKVQNLFMTYGDPM